MKKNTFIAANLAVLLTLGGCGNGTQVSSESPVLNSPEVDEASVAKKTLEVVKQDYQPNLWPKRDLSPARHDAIEVRATSILAKMSLEEKVGQMMQPELKYITPEEVKEYHIGSVLNGGGTTPNNNKYATVQDWANLAEQFYQASMDESDGKIGIPIIWGSDAVHGNNNVYGATLFPHNIGLGAARDPELIHRIGKVTAMEVAATGVDWTFGPTVAVARDVRWGRTYESYSEDPRIVREYAAQMVSGIQGVENTPGVFKPGHVVATAKHFVSDGGTTQGIDRGDAAIPEKDLVDIHAAGYFSALDGNVLTTMASFNSWNGDKLHGHKYLLTDILKGRMGFDGFTVSDWNGHMQVPGCNVKSCAQAINAGLDLVMVVSDWKEMYTNTIASVKNGEIPMSRIDDAVTRILRVKLHAGLFDAGPILKRQHVGDLSKMGGPEHRAVAQEAVRKSLVLLKNNGGILPISAGANVLIAGDGAHNIGKQAGGWSLTWQGTGNKNEDFPGASTIYDGFKAKIDGANGQTHLSEDGSWDEGSFSNGKKPDVAVVIYGEEPYAEWHGDITNIEFQHTSKRDLTLLKSLKEQKIPVVSVFITGRPLLVNKELNASDAFVVAWLPGSEGAGVADVLVSKADGSVNHDFQGKLSFSWPKNISQAVLNVGQDNYDPLFEYGYGLSYAAPQEVANNFDESSMRPDNAELEESWLFVSREMSDYQFHLMDRDGEPVVVNGNRQVSSNDENLLILSVDKVAQEDARRLVWKGLRPAQVSLTAKHPIYFNQYLENSSVLSFSMKVDAAPTGDVNLSMACGDDCVEKVSLTDALKVAKAGEYVDYQFDLNCFTKSDATLEALTGAFVMESTGTLDVAVADIKVIPNVSNSDKTSCIN